MAIGAKIGIKMMSFVIGIPVGIATKQVVERVWSVTHPDDPPRKASDGDVRWLDAVSWAALSAVGIVVADLMTRRGAEAAFAAITGNPPPQPKPGKPPRTLAKASEQSKATAD